MKPTLLDAIDVTEQVNLQFPFAAEIEAGETISGVELRFTVASGIDATPAQSLVGTPLIITSTAEVLQQVKGRVGGVVYKSKCIATLSSGRKLTRTSLLPVQDY